MGGPGLQEGVDIKSLQQNPSYYTVASLMNQMIGGTMLALPILYTNVGILAGVMIFLVLGVISMKTNLIYVDHLLDKEIDTQQTVKRILGKNYLLIYMIARFCYLILIAVIYFQLIAIQFYDIVGFFIGLSSGCQISEQGTSPCFAGPKEFSFSQWSVQYSTLISMSICISLLLLKNQVLLVKIAGYGVFSIIGYYIFIQYAFFSNIPKFSLASSMSLFTWNFGSLAGTASLAYTIHLNTTAVIKCNKNQQNNKRDVFMGYVGGIIVYVSIGIQGAFSILGSCTNLEDVNLITECSRFKISTTAQIPVLLVNFIYGGHLVTVFPIYMKLCKDSFFAIINKKDSYTQNQLTIFYAFVIGISLVIANIPQISPDAVMSLNGAVCCFFFVFLIPVMLHLKCYHGTNRLVQGIKRSLSNIGLLRPDLGLQRTKSGNEIIFQQTQSKAKLEQYNENYKNDEALIQIEQQQKKEIQQKLINNGNEQSIYSHESENENKINKKNENIYLTERTQSNNINHLEEEEEYEECNPHDQTETKYFTLRVILYSVVGCIGVSILVYQIYAGIAYLVKG